MVLLQAISNKQMGMVGESERVAAGTATYRSRSSNCCRDSCTTVSSRKDEEKRCDHYKEQIPHRRCHIAQENSDEASTSLTTATFTGLGARRKRQFPLSHSFLFIVLLMVFSHHAQESSSEVVRMRHPADHLYYGDRGGGGVGPPVVMHRHKKVAKESGDTQEYYTRASGEREAVGVDNENDDEDRENFEVDTLLGHTYAAQQQQFQQRGAAAYKRKSYNNINNNYNYNSNNNNNYESKNNISGSSDDANSNGFSSNSGNSASYYNYKNANIFKVHSQQQRKENDDIINDRHQTYYPHSHPEAAALKDVELPVYFARQGNDEPLEIDQPHVDVSGTSPKGPSTLSGSSFGSDSPSSAALGSETTPTGTGTEVPAEENGKLFPPDLFTLEQRRQGAVVFYIMGVMYMFVALAIVCDEFFVPSLDVIIEFLAIEDDVAGATFMAAGGSAPELFTSVIGVFISKDDVGIGTIVGSAVFNILFVIGMCALFSKTVLQLTWWPLFRDCSFYSIALITLIVFFQDSYIQWWEALILFSIYICYVTFMKFNQPFERALKKLLFKNRVTRVSSTDQLVNNKSVNNGASSSQTSVQTVSGNQSSRGSATLKPPLSASGRRNSIPMLHHGSKFRHGLLQLMIQSIDPLHDGRVDEKATQLHAIASLKALLDAAKTEADSTVTNNSRSKPVAPNQHPASVQPSDAPLTTVDIEDQQANGDAPTAQELAALAEAEDEGHEPLDISWPSGDCKKQISYIILFPIMICLFLTLPDTRTPRGKKFFAWGFLGSILWIAVFSYFMVWWADRTGETFGIAPEIMGLTFLAAGTSIPDLITSVIVARKGLGDMAVSSSVGSNIFDVCVGLPVPWLLYTLAKGEPIEVSAKGMLCSISILFGMLCFVVISIMLFKWRMNKGLGIVMFLLYFVFLGVSLLFEYNVITCPRFFEE